jgi:alpha-amylase
MNSLVSLGLVLTAIVACASAAGQNEWKSRVIYQLLTDRFAPSSPPSSPCGDLRSYCGGNFDGIVSKLDYIKGMGFDAIWISPIPVNIDGGYHGYWAQDIYQVNEHYGTEADLKALVDACHKRGMFVMLDVVANHMGNQPNGNFDDFSLFNPFNSSDHYHDYCQIEDWNNMDQVRNCRLANLPDLKQENEWVSKTLCSWVQATVAKFGFDGIRIDTVPEVPADFWANYAKASGVFTIGEVDNGSVDYDKPYQGPLDAILNYPLYWTLRDVFQESKTMTEIQSRFAEEKQKFKDVTVLGVFLDNHDNPRFLNIRNSQTALKNALAFALYSVGIPIVYYGTEQGFNGGNDPDNRESLWPSYDTQHPLYQFIKTCNDLRAKVGAQTVAESEHIQRFVDDTFYAFSRGNVFIATTNGESTQTRTITFHPFHDGQVLSNIFDPSDTVTVANNQFQVNLDSGLPKIYYPQ